MQGNRAMLQRSDRKFSEVVGGAWGIAKGWLKTYAEGTDWG